MSTSALVDVITVSFDNTYLCTVEYDLYNKRLNIIDIDKQHVQVISNLPYLDIATCGLRKLLLHIEHYLVGNKDCLELGNGVQLNLRVVKNSIYNLDNNYFSFCQNVIQPMYIISCSKCDCVYKICIPLEYIVSPFLYISDGISLVVPESIQYALSGLTSGLNCNFNSSVPRGIYGWFKRRKLNNELCEYIDTICEFYDFVRLKYVGNIDNINVLVRSCIGNSMDYLLRDELECSLLNTYFGYTYKWDYIEKAVPTEFSNFLLGNKLTVLSHAESLFPRSKTFSSIQKFKVLTIPVLDNSCHLGMVSYIINKDSLVGKFDFMIGKCVTLKMFIDDSEIKSALENLLILDSHTRNILCTTGDVKRYFINEHKHSSKEIDYFKGVDW